VKVLAYFPSVIREELSEFDSSFLGIEADELVLLLELVLPLLLLLTLTLLRSVLRLLLRFCVL
jgi:hypothetical protein